MAMYAILEAGEVKPVGDVMTWALWFESAERRVAFTETGDAQVSTVFLGINQAFGNGAELWFETMVFGGEHDEFTQRYSTLEQAMSGHEQAVAMVKSGDGTAQDIPW